MNAEQNGPDGMCLRECYKARWSRIYKPLPDGYSVWWHAETERYQGHGPNESASLTYLDRYACRRWCFRHAKEVAG